jgi:hypothetical protein
MVVASAVSVVGHLSNLGLSVAPIVWEWLIKPNIPGRIVGAEAMVALALPGIDIVLFSLVAPLLVMRYSRSVSALLLVGGLTMRSIPPERGQCVTEPSITREPRAAHGWLTTPSPLCGTEPRGPTEDDEEQDLRNDLQRCERKHGAGAHRGPEECLERWRLLQDNESVDVDATVPANHDDLDLVCLDGREGPAPRKPPEGRRRRAEIDARDLHAIDLDLDDAA